MMTNKLFYFLSILNIFFAIYWKLIDTVDGGDGGGGGVSRVSVCGYTAELRQMVHVRENLSLSWSHIFNIHIFVRYY